MKRIIFSITMGLMCIITIAQVPESFNYQAIVRNGGEVLREQPVSYQFSIIKGTPPGEVVYTEKHNITTNQFGMVNLAIGKGSDKTGEFLSINWGSDSYFLKIEIDYAGGTAYADMGTTQLLSVPYAMHTKSVTGVLNANNSTITNVAKPVNFDDAVNKEYVDALKEKINAIEEYLVTQSKINPMDLDGNFYNMIKIGDQYWLKENLRTTKFTNGDIIPDGTGIDSRAIEKMENKLYWFVGDSIGLPNPIGGGGYNVGYDEYYGRLYTPYVVNDERGICPHGWRVPNSEDWDLLIDYLGGPNEAAVKLIYDRDIEFSAKPTGYYYGIEVIETDNNTYYFSKMDTFNPLQNQIYRLRFNPGSEIIQPTNVDSRRGLSVRCIRK